MVRFRAIAIAGLLFAAPAMAIEPFPPAFKTQEIATNGTTLHVRVGGSGPAVVLLHGFGDTGDMWAPVAAKLVQGSHRDRPGSARHGPVGASRHRLHQEERGAGYRRRAGCAAGPEGRSGHPRYRQHGGIRPGGAVSRPHHQMGGDRCAAAGRRAIGRRSSAIPRPGISISTARTRNVWWRGGSASILDRFYNELSADPEKIDEATRAHYAALYARPHAMHDAFEQFVAFPQDGVDNRAFLAKGKLTMPVLALGGEKSYGAGMAAEICAVAIERQRRRHSRVRPLDHGRESGRDDQIDHRFSGEMSLSIRRPVRRPRCGLAHHGADHPRRGDLYPAARHDEGGRARPLVCAGPRGLCRRRTGRILGTCYLRANRPGPGAHIANAGFMVADEAGGRGLGEALCGHALAEAKTAGFRAMQFNFVVASNERAVRLWQRMGFAVVGRVPQAFDHPRLGLVDALVMFRDL